MRSMTVFNYLLEATVFGSVLILLLCVIRFFLRRKLGNRFIYIAWLIVALRVLIPITLPNPLMNEFRPTFSTDAEARPIADQIRTRFIAAFTSAPSNIPASAESTDRLLSPIHNFAIQTHQGQTGKWVLIAYVSIALLIVLWFAFSYLRFRRQTEYNRITSFEDEQLELYHKLLKRYGVKEIPAYFVDRLPNACLVGAFHPFIAIPTTISESQLPLVLAHVICHQKSHDGIWGLVRNVCCALQWFNPLVWMGAHLSRIDGELACDTHVTAKLQDLDRLAYADMLVSASALKETAPRTITTSTVLTDRRLKERIGSVIRFHHIKWWAITITSICAILVLLFAFSTSESSVLPTVDDIPVVSWSASLTHLPNAENAIAYTRRFMENQFIGIDTNDLTFSTVRTGDQWLVQTIDSGDGQVFSLHFSTDGTIYEFNGLAALADLQLSPCNKRRFSGSLNTYVSSFVDALIPSDSEWTGFITADVSTEGLRLVQCELYDPTHNISHIVVMQIAPSARVLGYRAGQVIE